MFNGLGRWRTWGRELQTRFIKSNEIERFEEDTSLKNQALSAFPGEGLKEPSRLGGCASNCSPPRGVPWGRGRTLASRDGKNPMIPGGGAGMRRTDLPHNPQDPAKGLCDAHVKTARSGGNPTSEPVYQKTPSEVFEQSPETHNVQWNTPNNRFLHTVDGIN